MTCDVVQAQAWPQEKHPDSVLNYGMSFEFQCARQWRPWMDVANGTCIRVFRAGRASGYQWKATQSGAGRTAGRFPQFFVSDESPIPLATTKDGSVVWTPEALSAASLERTINGTPTWVATGITITDPTILGVMAIAKLAGGNDGENYPVTIKAQSNDLLTLVEVGILKVRVPQLVCT